MKTKFLFFSMIFVAANLFSQITVLNSDIVDIGNNVYEALDTTSGSAVQIGASGPNQIWDFSNLQQNEVNITQYVDPNSTSFGFLYPTANICTIDEQNTYFRKSLSGVEIVGFDDTPLINPLLVLPLPLTYPMQFSSGPELAINQTEANDFLPDSLALFVSSGAAQRLDSIKVEVVLESSFNVDAWGNVIIPMGAFPALRLAVSSSSTQTILLYCTDTLFGISSGWYPAPSQLFPSETETDYSYQWWSNDPAVKFSLVNIDVDEYGYNDGEITFLTNSVNLVNEPNRNQDFIIYPIPATYFVNVRSANKGITDLKLLDINGKIVLRDQFVASTRLSLLSLPRGVYYIDLSSENRSLTKTIIVE